MQLAFFFLNKFSSVEMWTMVAEELEQGWRLWCLRTKIVVMGWEEVKPTRHGRGHGHGCWVR